MPANTWYSGKIPTGTIPVVGNIYIHIFHFRLLLEIRLTRHLTAVLEHLSVPLDNFGEISF